jgi:hypothetical protein
MRAESVVRCKKWVALAAAGMLAAVCGAMPVAASAAAAVAHYGIDATIAQASGTMSATVTITLQPSDVRDGTAFVIGDWYVIKALSIGDGITTTEGEASKPLAHARTIVLHLTRPIVHPVTLRVAYYGKLNEPDTKPGEENLVPGRMELQLEDLWLPVRSDLTMKFTADARIRGIPHDEVVVSQGTYHHVRDELDLHRAYPDFDLPIVAARGLNEFATPTVQVYAANLNSRLIRILRTHAVGAIDYYQSWFGPVPGVLPIRLVVTDRAGTGYERIGFTSIGAPPKELVNAHYPDYGPASLAAHETAHAWWDAADPMTDNYWLVESLAEYSSMRYIGHVFGPKILALRISKKQEEAKGAPPILGHGRPTRADLYGKGPLLLFQLQDQIGQQKMDKVLAILGRKPPHVTDDFLQVLAKVAGPKAAENFKQMLQR